MCFSSHLSSCDIISDLWYPIPLQKCWICSAPKWRRAALLSSISRKQRSLVGPPHPRRWREAHYEARTQTLIKSSSCPPQYLLQLAGYLGIPVIAWNADNSGLEKVKICSTTWFDYLKKILCLATALFTRANSIGHPVYEYVNVKSVFISQRTFYSSESSLGVLQLAPSIDHQISAMFSILERYPEIFH